MGHVNRGEPFLDDIGVEHGNSPADYFRVALEFAGAGELAHVHGGLSMPCVLGENAAHSAELALRAFLLSKMGSVEVRGLSARHNLEKLSAAAARRGLPIDSVAPRWCKMLNEAHGEPYLFR
jgi:hypothetical protein